MMESDAGVGVESEAVERSDGGVVELVVAVVELFLSS
jgi:hypothetical protein